MVQLFIDGGGFMWPILGIFIIGLSFVVERMLHLVGGMGLGEDFVSSITDATKDKGVPDAMALCESNNGPVSNLCLSALDRSNKGVSEAQLALESVGSIEMASLEKNMTWISLCIATAPMLGFLGTVWGMIQAFNDIKAANDISPAVVAGGISVALLTTAFGLVVAIILQLFQNICLYIIDKQIITMQKSATQLLNALKDIIKK